MNNKSIFISQQYLAMKIADIFNENVKKSLEKKSENNFFPSTYTIYEKEIVKNILLFYSRRWKVYIVFCV